MRNGFLTSISPPLPCPASTIGAMILLLTPFQSYCGKPETAGVVDFNRDIRPVLANKCMACHGPDENEREADLNLLSEESAKRDRDGYAVIKPGDSGSSELLKRILTDDPDLKMPPPELGKPLSSEEIGLLKRWIDSGAIWAKHWAYVRPVRKEPPRAEMPDWNRNFIDRFLYAKMREHDLHPSPKADRVTLIRRLYFDLIGLPPTPADVDAFLADSSDDAYEKLYNRLLGSSHFGEQMAVYWLDLVRYADTVGYHGDQDHNISPYRDWVINAFNSNMKFDQFTREQLAGDLLPNPTIQQKIASGYNRVLQTTHEGGLQPKEYLAIYAADRMRNLSAVWMGATLGCAQCHNHKYDPYTMKDFYSMQAFFADLDEAQHFKVGGNSLPTNRPPELVVWNPEDRKQYQRMQEKLAELNRQLHKHEEMAAQQSAAPTKTGALPNSDEKLSNKGKPQQRSKSDHLKDALSKQIKSLKSKSDALLKKQRKSMISVAIKPRIIRVLPRGNWLDESGEIVSPAIPAFMGKLETGERRPTRLDLANWLVDAKQGAGLLTARVLMNRLWYLMFGRGLADLADFGGQGTPPTHPELLDRLAIEFVDSGWDVKQMIRLLVSSQAYQQQSLVSEEVRKLDPQNMWYARQSRYRLPAESIRDNALAISGLLVEDVGGPSIRPYQPTGYYRHLNFPKRVYHHDQDSRQWRRGVYVHWQRQFLHPMLKAFDAPSREECTAQRPRSNTPLAALVLLNDPTFLEAARAFASRIMTEAGEDFDARLDFAFRVALSRSPDRFEKKLFRRNYERQFEYYRNHPEQAKKLQTVGISPVPKELGQTELATWTQLARILLNLNETTTRN